MTLYFAHQFTRLSCSPIRSDPVQCLFGLGTNTKRGCPSLQRSYYVLLSATTASWRRIFARAARTTTRSSFFEDATGTVSVLFLIGLLGMCSHGEAACFHGEAACSHGEAACCALRRWRAVGGYAPQCRPDRGRPPARCSLHCFRARCQLLQDAAGTQLALRLAQTDPSSLEVDARISTAALSLSTSFCCVLNYLQRYSMKTDLQHNACACT
jgi:hypothetical protein